MLRGHLQVGSQASPGHDEPVAGASQDAPTTPAGEEQVERAPRPREAFHSRRAKDWYKAISPFNPRYWSDAPAQRHPRVWTLVFRNKSKVLTQGRGTPPQPSKHLYGVLGRRTQRDRDDNPEHSRPTNRRRLG
ncbi:hypothetical protein VP01_783g4 [Puccinia sorghi]|uniref:Uncharacterized protein n=1 Tax=Puccinia sorghi TaxID=27349 RepID=A0A0L6UB06_9BASI|nr:hypothetical protein VP01_783g4 [Puccinia sorghi]